MATILGPTHVALSVSATIGGLFSEEEFEPTVVIPRECRHNPFLTDFTPIILVEEVSDARENSSSPLPKFKFGREIPNIVGGNEAFEGIAIVTKFIVNERTKKRDFESILIAIDPAGLDLVIWCICRRVAAVWTGGEFSVEQRDVAVEHEIAVWAGSATVDQRQNVQFGRGFKSNVTRIADVFGGSKTVRQNNFADLIFESEIETADVKAKIRERLSAYSIFKLKRIAFFEVAIYHAACSGWD